MKRKDILAELGGAPFDALVVGGGITGAGIALECARAGLRIALIEARDYASGTSSRSSKLVHGGLRYLAQGDFRLTRELVRDRTELLRAAPGLVKPLGFLLPVRSGDKYGRFVLGLGLAAYDYFAGARTRKWRDAAALLQCAPVLSPAGLKGGWSYLDAQTDDARLVFRVLAEARRLGAVAVNRLVVEAVTFGPTGVDGLRLRDAADGDTFEVKARCVFNATGAWGDRLRGAVGGKPKLRPLRGSHLLFDAWRLPLAQAIAFFHPDDRRPMFAIPWEGSTLVGTTDVDHRDDLDQEPGVTRAELDYILRAAQSEFPTLGLGEADIVSTWSGVRAVIASGANVDPSKEKRDSLILNENGLITVTGGKLTTFRSTAIAALKMAAEVVPGLKAPNAELRPVCAARRIDGRRAERFARRSSRAVARPLRRRRRRGQSVRRRQRTPDDPAHRNGLSGTALGVPFRGRRSSRRSPAPAHASGASPAQRRRRADAEGSDDRARGTRLERRALERRGRGLPALDRALLRDSQGADVSGTSDELLLAIDCGTQSVRALLIDLKGIIVAKRQRTLDGYVSAQNGWLEHDAEAFWQASASVCRALWAENSDLKARTKGVVVTAQRGSLTLVDAGGKPLRPFIIWLDQRRAHRTPPIPFWWRAAFLAARVNGTIDYLTKESELNWIAEHEPERLARTHKVLLVSGWLNYRLTGRFANSVGSQVGYIPFDYKRHGWAGAWDWKWSALAGRRDQMPDLVPVGSVLGTLTGDAAEATGLPAGLPVIAGAADKACEILGAGAITPDVGAISYGTTATINVTMSRYVEAIPFIPPYPAALPGQFIAEVQIFRGFWMVSWFKQQFGHPEIAAALSEGVAPEALFDRLVQQAPPGSDGLMLQPYWTPGVRTPGPEARGAVIGFTDAHTRAHLFRAILEGLAYALREGSERIQARTGVPVTSLRVSGGGSQSDAALQVTADVFNRPTSRPHTFETSGLGAAMVGAVGLVCIAISRPRSAR